MNPHGQIIIRAEILSTSFSLSVSWHHGRNIYNQHIREDPFCDPVEEVRILLVCPSKLVIKTAKFLCIAHDLHDSTQYSKEDVIDRKIVLHDMKLYVVYNSEGILAIIAKLAHFQRIYGRIKMFAEAKPNEYEEFLIGTAFLFLLIELLSCDWFSFA